MRLWLRTLTLWSTLPLCAANRTRSFGCWLNARRHWMVPAPCSALITRSRAVHPWRAAGTCDDVELLREFHIITPAPGQTVPRPDGFPLAYEVMDGNTADSPR